MQLRFPAHVNIIGLVSIFAVTLVLFYPTFFIGFLFDDWGDLFNAYGTVGDRLKELLPTNGDWRAVTRIFWWLDYQLFGTEPLGYHLLNFAIHLLIIVMVWHLARLLTGNDWVALCAAFLFSINKGTVSPVAWISAAIDQKLLLFALLSIFIYIRTARLMAESGRYPLWRILIFTLAAWLAFKSKLMSWTLPGVYLLIDFIYLNITQDPRTRGIESAQRWIKITWPLYILILAYIPHYLSTGGGIPTSGEYAVSLNPLNYFASWSKYFASAFGLNGYYSSTTTLLAFGILGVAVFLYGIICRNRNILFGMLWFSITIVPVAILTKHHFDHHLYLPLFGLALAMAALLYDVTAKMKLSRGKPLTAISSVVICLYAFVMHPSFKDWIEQTQDAPKLATRTLAQIHRAVPELPKEVTFYIYPTPRFSLLNFSAPLNFLYQKFSGITVNTFDNQLDFDKAILTPSVSAWYAFRYEPSDGSVALVKSHEH